MNEVMGFTVLFSLSIHIWFVCKSLYNFPLISYSCLIEDLGLALHGLFLLRLVFVFLFSGFLSVSLAVLEFTL